MRTRQKRAVYHEGPRAAEQFESSLRHILSVSKEELARREASYKESRAHKDRPGPRPKSRTK